MVEVSKQFKATIIFDNERDYESFIRMLRAVVEDNELSYYYKEPAVLLLKELGED